MNKDEWISLIASLVGKAAGATLGVGVVTSNDATTIAGGIFVIGSLGFTLYNNWNQRKVAETAVVTATAPTVAAAKADSIPAGK